MCQSKADGGKRCRCADAEKQEKRRAARNDAQKHYLKKRAAMAAEMDQVTDAEPQPVNPFAHLTNIDTDDLPAVTPEQREAAAVEWAALEERIKVKKPVNPFAGITAEKIAAQTARK